MLFDTRKCWTVQDESRTRLLTSSVEMGRGNKTKPDNSYEFDQTLANKAILGSTWEELHRLWIEVPLCGMSLTGLFTQVG